MDNKFDCLQDNLLIEILDEKYAYDNSEQKQNILAKFTWDTGETIGIGTYNRGWGKGVFLELPAPDANGTEQTFFSLSLDGKSMDVDFLEVVKLSNGNSDMIIYSALLQKSV